MVHKIYLTIVVAAGIFQASSAAFSANIPQLGFPLKAGARTVLGFGDPWGFARGCDGAWKVHTGRDLKVTAGTPVYAMADGVGRAVLSDPQWRGAVTLEHRDSQGQKFTTGYWHIMPLVKVGQQVRRGQPIAVVASMGTNTHLHVSVRNAPYSNVANRGALPRTRDCGPSDPPFPGGFIDPATRW
jgi:murein DD-endopeptidase MepM/ murein hydrolase activator NlpD